MKKMYNQEIKEQFLSTFPFSTAKTYRYAFYRSYDAEEMMDKDVYNFTVEEVFDVIKSANHTTLNSINLTFGVFEKYMDWAMKYRLSSINLLSNISRSELMECLDRSKKLFLSEDELIEIENKLINAQDQVVIRLIFEGALGYKNSELVNLKIHDVDFENKTIKLKDDAAEKTREITVSNRCLRLIESAMREKEYYPKNGTVEVKRKYFEVVSGVYVVRNTKTGSLIFEDGKSDTHTTYRRITNIKEFFGLPYINPKNIRASGMIKMAKDLYLRDGKLENEQLTEIAVQYGVKKTKVNGQINYNFSYLREIINAHNIMDLYNVDITELTEDNVDLPDENLGFFEGEPRLKQHIFRERRPEVIKIAKERFKSKHNGRLFCKICKFDFYEKYGQIGKDFIEGHHIIPISELKEGDETKVEDIAIVCSNCHRMLHRRETWLTKEQLIQLMNE